MKEEAIARGYDRPLPFGVSVIYNYIARDIDVTDIRIGVAHTLLSAKTLS